MKEVIWLAVSRQQVVKMTKNPPELRRGEIPLKVLVEVDPAAFGTPTLEAHVKIADWREGLVFADPELADLTITEAEADLIRRQRLDMMQRMLAEHGYTVTPPAEQAADG